MSRQSKSQVVRLQAVLNGPHTPASWLDTNQLRRLWIFVLFVRCTKDYNVTSCVHSVALEKRHMLLGLSVDHIMKVSHKACRWHWHVDVIKSGHEWKHMKFGELDIFPRFIANKVLPLQHSKWLTSWVYIKAPRDFLCNLGMLTRTYKFCNCCWTYCRATSPLMENL